MFFSSRLFVEQFVNNFAYNKKLCNSCSTSFSLEVLSRHTEAINREVQEVLRVSQEMVARCSIETIRCNMEDSLAKMDALSHQLCQVAKAKLKHCQSKLSCITTQWL